MKIKFNADESLKNSLNKMATIVRIGNVQYKFLPYWFEFTDDNEDVYGYHLDNTPDELKNAIQILWEK